MSDLKPGQFGHPTNPYRQTTEMARKAGLKAKQVSPWGKHIPKHPRQGKSK